MLNKSPRWLPILFSLSLLLVLNCSSTGTRQYQDGRLHVINNTRPPKFSWGPECVHWVRVIYEDRKIDIPHNMDYDGNQTGAGAIELTDLSGPLPGGTAIQLEYIWEHQGGRTICKGNISVTIDGTVTVEIYLLRWDHPEDMQDYPDVIARVLPGIFTGTHYYAQ